MTTLHTIGHSRHAAERFVELLRMHDVALLVDVRSHPVSRWAPHFAKAALARTLQAAGITYEFLGRELGGRPAGADYLPDGTLDVAARARAPELVDGIARLVALARARRTAIMCAEEDPAHCHRTRLLAPAVMRAGIAVAHIRGDGRIDGAQLALL